MNFLKPTIFLFLIFLVSCSQSLSAQPAPISCDVPQLQDISSKLLEGVVYGRRVRGVEKAYLGIHDFKIIQPVLSNEGVLLPRKAEISIYAISYPLISSDKQRNAKLLEGKTFSYGLGQDSLLNSSTLVNTFALSFLEKDKTYTDSRLVYNDYKFLAKFGKLNQGKIPVKLYVCASSLATQVSGSFEVEFGNEPSGWESVKPD